jgi:3D (Asp-Asp-Asp) domain-containing protein
MYNAESIFMVSRIGEIVSFMIFILLVALCIAIIFNPSPVLAPVMFPGVVQEHQKPEPEPETMTIEATAYTWTGNRTVTGTWPSRGTVAVDPRVIPLGTELHIEGYGPAVAADTGGVIKGEIIDLYMDSEHECRQWGRRQVQIQIRR